MFAPFFAAGMLTVFWGGGVFGAIVFAAASAALILLIVKKKKASVCAAGVLCGLLLMTAYVRAYYMPISAYAGETITARIFVREVVSRSGQSEELIAKTTIDGRPVKLRLSCPEALPENHFADVTIELEPISSDELAENLASEIFLSGEITEISSAEYGGADVYSVFRAIRGSFFGRLEANVFGNSGQLAAAMLFGEKGALSPVCAEQLRISGAAHYTAVSGAHFAVFAAALLAVIPQRRRRTRFVVSLMFAPAGLLFYGASPSVLRASVMFLLYSLGMMLHRKAHPLNSLCIAVTVIPIFSPSTILDAGFAMSVLGVFGVGVIGPALSEKLCEFIPDKAKRALSPIVTALACSACAVICTAPISAALFGNVSLLGAITSLLLAPLMSTAMMCMILLGAFDLRLFAIPIDWTMRISELIIGTLGKCRVLCISLDFKGAWVLCALLATAVTVCAFCGFKSFTRLIKPVGALAAVIIAVSLINVHSRREVRFAGNTNTSAAIVINGNSAEVFIAGGGDGLSGHIAGELRKCGAVRITKLAVYDADYGGALAIKELSDMLPIGEVVSNELAEGLMPSLNVTPPTDNVFRTNGITIAAANSASPAPKADILLCTGRPDNVTGSFAQAAVYFSKTEYELPENFFNARLDEEFRVKLAK